MISRVASLRRWRRRSASPQAPAANHRRRLLAGGSILTLAAAALAALMTLGAAADSPGDGLGIQPGKIRHVWLIILENKSYDASFSGLNNNTYLWQTLPSQGALLTNYYGTGHFSLDNYISLASGQATQPDDQDDCPYYDDITGNVDTGGGSLTSNANYGQLVSAAGANAAPGTNGCVYPASVPTLFNQLDAAHVSWKGYAQDLGNADASSSGTLQNPGSGQSHDAGVQYCGAPYSSPGPTGSTAYPNPGAANATDQYVPKHFPFPWFESILQSGDCNAQHIASLFDPADGLYHDLQHASTTPAFSWITPDNCSDAHDAVCHGNNLSGGFSDPNTPKPPVNYTGGLYAADLFLEHIVPEIEASPAFKEGGLIDITFDEAFPPFTYSGNSFANSTTDAPDAATSIADDSAAETLFGKPVHSEPTGPNTPLATAPNGQQLYPGPGYNSYIDRPSDCVSQPVDSTSKPGYLLPKNEPANVCLIGGGNYPTPDTARTDTASAAGGASTIADNSIVATDAGRGVSGAGIPANACVGAVADTPQAASAPAQSGGGVDTGSFQLVDCTSQAPIQTSGAVSGSANITLGARTPASDPLYDAYDATTGGGDTGSVLISPYIRPGTVSDVYYNHYSWLRTMEDLFDVGHASPGLDGEGHIGYAAQPGLAPFGADVFTNPNGEFPLGSYRGGGYWGGAYHGGGSREAHAGQAH
jgi:Phosphoesterase family